jgi:hypothetical protein
MNAELSQRSSRNHIEFTAHVADRVRPTQAIATFAVTP